MFSIGTGYDTRPFKALVLIAGSAAVVFHAGVHLREPTEPASKYVTMMMTPGSSIAAISAIQNPATFAPLSLPPSPVRPVAQQG